MRRHLGNYIEEDEIDATFAAYLADAIEALQFRWDRTYAIDFIAPGTYSVEPDVESKDKRPIILMASIIYKMGTLQLAGFRDGDFSYDPQQGRQNPIQMDVEELARFLPIYRLAKATTGPLRGYNSLVNPESYKWLAYI